MKNRIFTWIITSFIVGILCTLFQEAYFLSETSILFGFTPILYFYLLCYAIVSAILLEVWNYLLCYLVRYARIVYLLLFLCNVGLWIGIGYVSIFYVLYSGYIAVLFVFQLFSYKEANEELKKLQELL